MRHLIKSVVLSFTLCGSAASAEPIQQPTSSGPPPSHDAPIILAEQKFGEIAKVRVDRAGRICPRAGPA